LPIEGLYLVGGDAGGWGIGTEMAAKSALECAELIMEKKAF
jgi:prolycopene isomerase